MDGRDARAAAYQLLAAALYGPVVVFLVPLVVLSMVLGGGSLFVLVLAPVLLGVPLAHVILALEFRKHRSWDSRRVRRTIWFLILVEPVLLLYLVSVLNAGWVVGPMSWIFLVAVGIIAADVHAVRHARRSSRNRQGIVDEGPGNGAR